MPAVSQAQARYAGLIKSGKVNASPKKKAWANELIDKQAGTSIEGLPEKASEALRVRTMSKGGRMGLKQLSDYR